MRTAGPQPRTFPAQCAPLDLNLGPFQLSAHRWTSTWDLPSSVRTAGPQPGTSQLSVHRWTSTWDLPSSVRTAGPRRPDRMPEDMPDKMPEDMPEHMLEDTPDRMPEDMSDRMPEDLPVRKCINVMVWITRSKVFFSREGLEFGLLMSF